MTGFRPLILHLGGAFARLWTTGDLARLLPTAPVIISTEMQPHDVLEELASFGVAYDRVTLDYRAWDTVTNLTKTVDLVRAHGTTDLYLVSDLSHLRRAGAIAAAVYTFRAPRRIHLVPSLCGDLAHYEREGAVWGDMTRALVWRFTGILLHDRAIRRRLRPQLEAAAAEAARLTGRA